MAHTCIIKIGRTCILSTSLRKDDPGCQQLAVGTVWGPIFSTSFNAKRGSFLGDSPNKCLHTMMTDRLVTQFQDHTKPGKSALQAAFLSTWTLPLFAIGHHKRYIGTTEETAYNCLIPLYPALDTVSFCRSQRAPRLLVTASSVTVSVDRGAQTTSKWS